MPKLTDYTELVQSIYSILEEGDKTDKELAELLAERIKYNNTGRVQFMMNVLFETGQVGKLANGKYAFLNEDNRDQGGAESQDSPTGVPEHVVEEIREMLKEEKAKTKSVETEMVSQRKDIATLTEEVKRLKDDSSIHTVQVKKGKKIIRKVEGIFHTKFAKMLKFGTKRKNIFLYGPTGCGKSHVSEQLAGCLSYTTDGDGHKIGDPLPFYYISCTSGMSEGKLEGRRLPNKGGNFEYLISEFVRAFENGGVFLLDELDAADPNVLLIINSALSNGQMALPNRNENPVAIRHPDFVCIATANTLGTNADRMYSGRNKLDAATLDRFGVAKLKLDYDSNIESQLCENKVLLKLCLKIRKAINEHRLERAMSTRFILDAQEMLEDDLTYTDLFGDLDDGFFSGWREDEYQAILADVPILRDCERIGMEPIKFDSSSSDFHTASGFVLPELDGSPKQIKWATSLRRVWFENEPSSRTRQAICEANQSSTFWIDNRHQMSQIFEMAKQAGNFTS